LEGSGDRATTIKERHLATVQRGYELWNRGDIEGLWPTCFTDDVEWVAAPEWPGQQRFVGRDAVTRFLREEVAELIALQNVQIDRIEQVDRELVIAINAETRGVASGIELASGEIFHVVRLRDGRIDRVRTFPTAEAAIAAAKAG
jgi:ketosteroid isomerase-like protein